MCVSNNFKFFNHVVNFDFCLYFSLVFKKKNEKRTCFILLSLFIFIIMIAKYKKLWSCQGYHLLG